MDERSVVFAAQSQKILKKISAHSAPLYVIHIEAFVSRRCSPRLQHRTYPNPNERETILLQAEETIAWALY